MTTKIYRVPGMHCASCPKLIALALEDVPGVHSVDARLDDKRVAINFDETVTDDHTLEAAIRAAGYEPLPTEPASL